MAVVELLQSETGNLLESFGVTRLGSAREMAAEVRNRRTAVLEACLHQGDAVNAHFQNIYRNMVEALNTLIETGANDKRDIEAKEMVLKEFEDWFDQDDPAFLNYQMRVASEALFVRSTRNQGLRMRVMGVLGALVLHS